MQKILHSEGLGHLDAGDQATRDKPVRYVRDNPGDLVHVDVKKLAAIPDGGGWRVHGRGNTGPRQRGGYVFIHSALDDNSRLVYSEILTDETGETAAEFWKRAHRWYAQRGVAAERVLTDNGGCFRSRKRAKALKATRSRHKRTRPYRPQTNGKVCEDCGGAVLARSDPGKSLTVVSLVRFVGRAGAVLACRCGRCWDPHVLVPSPVEQIRAASVVDPACAGGVACCEVGTVQPWS